MHLEVFSWVTIDLVTDIHGPFSVASVDKKVEPVKTVNFQRGSSEYRHSNKEYRNYIPISCKQD